MNAAQVKNIPIERVLSKLGFSPDDKKHQGNELWYKSPFRDEKTASFKIDVRQNLWHDFGMGEGGSVIDLVMQLRNIDFKTALTVLVSEFSEDNLAPLKTEKSVFQKNRELPQAGKAQEIFILKAVKDFPFSENLEKYIVQERGIDLKVASTFLKEIHFENSQTGKSYFAVGLGNREGGYEIRNPFFKSTVPETTKSISWIKNGNACTKILCFEGFMDFLSYATLFGTRATEDYLILNSVSHVQKGLEAIKNAGYETIETFFDNDVAGQKATEVFKSEIANVKSQNAIYAENEDLNAYLVNLRQKI